ncbi:hypothetical protein QUF61_05250 [Candidatus Venteria ishoeyi]|uniref:hypothetical protein n=1 Tax=Candidatus Venteria ishoeyi TaxID=1899563 RepID=UPI0025A689DA|nr:hypothetical protein [Candidatus Venteria ishoeyi]MDM8545877.1 hypothetical protein [Candidatus Venteria ishoeyi]
MIRFKLTGLFHLLCICSFLPSIALAECRLNSSEPHCLGPAVHVFANYTYAQEGVLYFHKTVFNQADVRFDEGQLLPWIAKMAQEHAALKKALLLIQKQYVDLAQRLHDLAQGRAGILRDFGADADVSEMDADERNLSAMGIRLSEVSQNFFPAIKPKLLQLRKLRERQKVLKGLRGFEQSLDEMAQKISGKLNQSGATNKESIDVMNEVIVSLEQALRDFEQAVNQGN